MSKNQDSWPWIGIVTNASQSPQWLARPILCARNPKVVPQIHRDTCGISVDSRVGGNALGVRPRTVHALAQINRVAAFHGTVPSDPDVVRRAHCHRRSIVVPPCFANPIGVLPFSATIY